MAHTPLTLSLGFEIVESSLLPVPLEPGDHARRIVRHGMAEILAWLGEDVGPSPDEQTHCYVVDRTILVSSHLMERLRAKDQLSVPGVL